MDKMIVHLNVLGLGVKNGVLRKLDVVEVVAVYLGSDISTCKSFKSLLFGSHVVAVTPRYLSLIVQLSAASYWFR